MTKLGARPLNPVVEPPPAAAEPEPPETDETRAFDAELEDHLAHLRSLDPSDPHIATDMLDAIDLIDHHIGGWDSGAELRPRIQKGVAAKARAELAEHLAWAEQSFAPGVDRTRAQLHGFNLYMDNLDIVEDAETIAIARSALGIPNPDSDES
jgi:hypothetical protein